MVPTPSEVEEEHKGCAELSTSPMAKRACQCCCQTYAEILSFLEKRSEAEQRLREEELALRREELDIERSTFFIVFHLSSSVCSLHVLPVSPRVGTLTKNMQ